MVEVRVLFFELLSFTVVVEYLVYGDWFCEERVELYIKCV